MAGAAVDVIALAAVRATREAEIRRGGQTLHCIVGVPEAGEPAAPPEPSRVSGRPVFDGQTELAVFPGELPEDAATLFAADAVPFRGLTAVGADEADFRFVRFRPPLLMTYGDGDRRCRISASTAHCNFCSATGWRDPGLRGRNFAGPADLWRAARQNSDGLQRR